MSASHPSRRKITRFAVAGALVLFLLCLVVVVLALIGPFSTYQIFLPNPKPLELSQADEITIDYQWGGLAPTSPVNASYTLKRTGEAFTGKASFSVHDHKAEEEISVPADAAASFLRQLARSKMEKFSYVPKYQWTDDYPLWDIVIKADGKEIAKFHSTSQGEEYVPWQATVNGYSYVVNSGIPFQAFKILKPYLKQDVLESLKDSAEW